MAGLRAERHRQAASLARHLDLERFEAWLAEHGIAITGQVATGSGDMVRYHLRLVDGSEHSIAIGLETLTRAPEQAIAMVDALIELHEATRRRAGGN